MKSVPKRREQIVLRQVRRAVLMLTAIVVGVATMAVGLALVIRIQDGYGTIEENEIHEMDADL